MVNKRTVELIGYLNDLAEESEDGIRPFSTATPQDKDGLWYDDENPVEIDEDDGDTYASYPLVSGRLVDELHHDIISTWTEDWEEEGIQFTVAIENNSEPVICVTSKGNDDFYDDFYIVI
jgi:hypothetical protein